MKNPKISIIVPVYNVENYLNECIVSIQGQSFKNWECILVDDGSLDRSGVRCDEYAELDSRFRVIHKSNGGLSQARNVGIETAQGDYLVFIDSDDYWKEATVLQNLVNLMDRDDDIDIVQYHTEPFNDGEDECFQNTYGDSIEWIVSNDEVLESYYSGKIRPQCWNKIYRKNLLLNIRFPEGRWYEDNIFLMKLLPRLNKIALFPGAGTYMYRQRSGSIMNQTYKKTLRSHIEQTILAASMLELVSQYGIGGKIRIDNTILGVGSLRRAMSAGWDEKEEIKRIVSLLSQYMETFSLIKNNLPVKEIFIYLIIRCLKARTAVQALSLFKFIYRF